MPEWLLVRALACIAIVGATIPFWPRFKRRMGSRLPRALARAALPEPAVSPGAQHLNPGRLVGETCVGCGARRDESMPLRQRMLLSNVHSAECPRRDTRVVWK